MWNSIPEEVRVQHTMCVCVCSPSIMKVLGIRLKSSGLVASCWAISWTLFLSLLKTYPVCEAWLLLFLKLSRRRKPPHDTYIVFLSAWTSCSHGHWSPAAAELASVAHRRDPTAGDRQPEATSWQWQLRVETVGEWRPHKAILPTLCYCVLTQKGQSNSASFCSSPPLTMPIIYSFWERDVCSLHRVQGMAINNIICHRQHRDRTRKCGHIKQNGDNQWFWDK